MPLAIVNRIIINYLAAIRYLNLVWLLTLLSTSFFIFAQVSPPNIILTSPDTSIHITQVVPVQASRIQIIGDNRTTQQLDSTVLHTNSTQNLAEVLSIESSLNLKSYGQGSLASSSLRGGSAAHTALVWNGIALQSPMNGLYDMSLIPINFIQNINIQQGGASALWGSGAIGGSIHLTNTPHYKKHFSWRSAQSISSAQQYKQHWDFSGGNKRYNSQWHVFHQYSPNKFTYVNTNKLGNPIERQDNALVKQYGLLSDNYYKIDTYQQVSLKVWLQQNLRQIPPTLTTGHSQAQQQDFILRVLATYQYHKKHWHWHLRSAYFNEQITYNDSAISLLANNKAQTYINELNTHRYLHPQWRLQLGINTSHYQAQTDGYGDRHVQQTNGGTFVLLNWHSVQQHWKAHFSYRQNLLRGRILHPITAMGISYQTSLKNKKLIQLYANLNNNYRIPTFNDLYWVPSGNMHLQPENAIGQDIGVKYEQRRNWGHIQYQASWYNNWVRNWIIWLPSAGIWTPINSPYVWARGIETRLLYNHNYKHWTIKTTVSYQFTRSTNEQPRLVNDPALHKQLIYVPYHNAQANMQINWRQYRFLYWHTFTGKRFITSDNAQFLPAYNVANIQLQSQFAIKKWRLLPRLTVYNIFNVVYETVAFRPMPLRYYEVGIQIYWQ